ncbi:hypothetical protein [Vibrio quintilis]|uniref:Uncharacterized protein n=1 Tax=Vibrio quintilis TaxID=1117707 RepID=A0A1M7YPF8_9VIBR|nr:hypothetical protein [Vibrio quintilis]SHO54386.1 hypothetical protein VQ7734_00100 [Vibrio quintilis]
MKFTDNEIREMRKELARNAFQSFIRHMPGDENDVYGVIAHKLIIKKRDVIEMSRTGVPHDLAQRMSELAQMFDIHMYPHQFAPTTQICINWLTYAYEQDKGNRSRAKRSFNHWDESRRIDQIREAA